MSPGNDCLPTAVLTAKERDLQPMLEESAELLELDGRQIAEMEIHLRQAWFFGVKTGHRVIAERAVGEADPMASVLSLQDEFRELMEGCADALNLTVAATLAAWNYLRQAWLAGAEFWEVEIAARLIEWQAGGFESVLGRLDEGQDQR
jgi:hypothetical protein